MATYAELIEGALETSRPASGGRRMIYDADSIAPALDRALRARLGDPQPLGYMSAERGWFFSRSDLDAAGVKYDSDLFSED